MGTRLTTGPDRPPARDPAPGEPADRSRVAEGRAPTLPGTRAPPATVTAHPTFDPYLAVRRPTDRSLAGWSHGGPAPLTAAERDDLATPADARYHDLELAGAGGMGTVMMAHDRRLGRDIAIKRVGVDGDDPVAQRRLAREARITARLEHPGIVPIYDAGVGADGRSYYAMRLIRGRSLAEILDDLPDPGARLPLLRSFLAVCQAVAYAHRHGVAHLDLKPSNVMIGEFGETLVVDWGLAQHLDEHDAEPGVGAPAGTPAYLSPERARGARGGATADVWGLGAILVELLTGRPLMPASTIETLALLSADAAPVRSWPERAPHELRAVADKALAWDEAQRYRDAEELARDVAAYLDGRRVAAHDYSTLELARRLVIAWRWQLIAIAAAVVAAIAVLGFSRHRIEGQRARAVTAEQRAQSALGETRAALGLALEQSAVAALTAGDLPAAETYAAAALGYGESVEARGVLAATRSGSRPAAAMRIDLPGCPAVIPDDYTHALCREPAHLARWELGSAAVMWRRALVASDTIGLGGRWVVALEDGVAMTMLDAATGEPRARWPVPIEYDELIRDHGGTRAAVFDSHTALVLAPDAAGGPAMHDIGRPCDREELVWIALGRQRVYGLCGDGRLLAVDDAGQTTLVAALPDGPRLLGAIAVDEHETMVVIGDLDGRLRTVALTTGVVSDPTAVLDERVAQIAMVGDLIAVTGERGGARVWNRALDVELMRLPETSGRIMAVDGATLMTGGSGWWRWTLTPAPHPRRFATRSGLSSAAISPDGRIVAAARGDGRIAVWSTANGELLAEPTVADQVVKRIDFSADGALLAAAISGPVGSAVLDARTWTAAPHRPATIGAARIAYLADDELIALHRDHYLSRWQHGQGPSQVPVVGFIDAERTADRSALWLLTRAGQVVRYQGGALTEGITVPGAEALAATADGRTLAIATPMRVELHDLERGTVVPLIASGDPVVDVAISPDDQWLAAATIAGTIDVWSLRDGRWVAHLRGHQRRVAWVGFAAGALWSASWDRVVLRWDLTALAASPAALVADAAATWALPQPP